MKKCLIIAAAMYFVFLAILMSCVSSIEPEKLINMCIVKCDATDVRYFIKQQDSKGKYVMTKCECD